MAKIYAYARCSLGEECGQDLRRQTRELEAAGAEEIFLEYEHGDAAVKKQLTSLLEKAEAGSQILVLEISRLARSTKQLCDIIDIIKEKHLCLRVLGSITVDCSSGVLDPMTNAFVQMSGVFAELELRIIRERVRSGMANAKAKGSKIGRPQTTKDNIPELFYKYYPAYAAQKINKAELARLAKISRTSVYKYLEIVEKS